MYTNILLLFLHFLKITKHTTYNEGSNGNVRPCDQLRGIKDKYQSELDALDESVKKCSSKKGAIKSDVCSLTCRLNNAKKQRELVESDLEALCKQLENQKIEQKSELDELRKNCKVNDGQTQNELNITYESKHQKLLNFGYKFKDKLSIYGVDIIKCIIDSREALGSKWKGHKEKENSEIEGDIEAIVKKTSKLQDALAKCTTKKNNLKIIAERHKREHDKNLEKLRCLQHELIELLNQHQNLIDIKLLLDFELAAYCQMLATENNEIETKREIIVTEKIIKV